MWAIGFLIVLLGCARVQAAAGFAHFMVENAKTWDSTKWGTDIDLAKKASIDGFALNIRADDASAWDALNTAFQVAEDKGDFKMILSFDYAGGGAWSANIVQQYILQFSAYSSYYLEGGQPLVSTFEGPANSGDWSLIKQKTNALFIPDWSSLGAKQALEKSEGVVDGLFSWSGWPWGNMNMNTYVDASYLEFMDTYGSDWGKDLKYMMPASPWFYTNLPGYDKNWMWRGDSLWYDRWQEIIFLNPDYVEIISWNDFGESHHIGPLYVSGDDYQAFTVGEAPFNYAEDMPHDGWREFLPFVIALYKDRKATISQEGLSGWYRVTPKQSGCDDGWTTGNTASQLQQEFYPYDIVEDKIFYTALLASSQSVTVTVGGVDLGATWTNQPEYGSGLYHGSVAYGSNLGAVVITVGSMTLSGREITSTCDHVDGQNGQQNWNAWVGSQSGATVNKEVDISKWVCINGTAPGAPEFAGLCEFTCQYGYCPTGACLCTNMGAQREEPNSTGVVGYPAEGMSASYSGLCTFACNLGYCPSEYCDTTEHATVVPSVSPFTPDACTSGSGTGGLTGLCDYACNYGFCPIHSCTCTSTGALHDAPAQTENGGYAKDGLDARVYDAICDFACSRGYCPEDSCIQNTTDTSGGSDGNPVYIGTQIFSTETAYCTPPCILVLPPSELPSSTTINPPSYTTSIEIGTTTSTITVSVPPVTVGEIPFSNVPVSTTVTDGAVFVACTSLALDPVDVTITYTTAGKTSITTRALTLPPWPQMTEGPPDSWTESCDVWGGAASGGAGSSSKTTTFTPTDDFTSTTTTPLPTWTDFPPSNVESDDDDDDDDDDDNIIVVDCSGLWFFSFCIDFPEFKVTKWKFTIPSGKIGPGPPPPNIIQRDGWKIKIGGDLPPWPVITIPPGPSPVMTSPDKPSDCNTISQEVHFETVSQGLSVSDGTTITTTESTITRTAFVYGCEVTDYTETVSSCEVKRTLGPADAVVEALATPTPEPKSDSESESEAESEHDIEARAAVDSIFNQDNSAAWANDMSCPGQESDYILYPLKHTDGDVSNILARLTQNKGTNNFDFLQVKSDAFGYTSFFVITQMPRSMQAKVAAMSQVRYLYDYQNFLKTGGLTYTSFGPIKRKEEMDEALNEEVRNATAEFLSKRASKQAPWQLSQLGTPSGVDWLNDNKYVATSGGTTYYNYWYDSSAGSGQVIYVLEDSFPYTNNHAEFQSMTFGGSLDVPSYGPTSSWDPWHGAAVIAAAAGQYLGVAPAATVVPVSMGGIFNGDQALERSLHALILIADHIKNNNYQKKAVINMSWGIKVDYMNSVKPFAEQLVNILSSLENDLGVVLVTASGNDGRNPTERSEKWYPQKFAHTSQLSNMLVVGSVDQNARRAATSNYFTGNQPALIYGWGHNVLTPDSSGGYTAASGTSFAAPGVAGLVAYFRGLPSTKYATALQEPKNAVELVRKMVRPLTINDPSIAAASEDGAPDALVWNGQIEDTSCLVQSVNGCPSYLSPGGDSDIGGEYTFSTGSPSPTCTAGCGTLCTGYYCDPTPTGSSPDFADPANPNFTVTKASTTAKTTKTTSTAAAVPTTVEGDNAIDVLYTEGGEFPSKLWYWMNSLVNSKVQDECNRAQLVTISAGDDVDVKNPGMPPYDTDFAGNKLFNTLQGCAYTHSSTGGTIACDGGVKVDCKASPDDTFVCTDSSRFPGMTMVPTVRCDFAAYAA